MTNDTMIHLEKLTKRFLGQKLPAVDELTLPVPRGEIVVLVGPSGCGKTTTLEMVNRLVKPTSGRIFLDGEDVTDMPVNDLRRRMGYVIQQIGLFPHQTIAENIATVPRLLGWDKRRIDERVDELLDLVGLEPSDYRDRYPKQMSGGQRQRIGVARAMGADPPVLLMDEPFGAVDPITRSRLQDEFLRLQQGLRKTIVFVTHDIDEAIKLGDRIAILQVGSKIAQYDTPENILGAPASPFVDDFLGSGRVLKSLNFLRVRELDLLDDCPTATRGDDRESLRRAMEGHDRLLVLDEQRRPWRWLTPEHLADGQSPEAGTPAEETCVSLQDTLQDALQVLLVAEDGLGVVVAEDGSYAGQVDLAVVNEGIRGKKDRYGDKERVEARPTP